MYRTNPPSADAVLPLQVLLLCACCLLGSAAPTAAGGHAGRWLLIDTERLTLTVMVDERPQMTLHDIAIGRFGARRDKRHGDNTTPQGRFKINDIRPDRRFHRFIGLDYPGVEQAERARQSGVIGEHEFQAIAAAHRRGQAPPQNTALGGHIGIHGLGQGDRAVHEMLNWTRGCVALTDDQIDTLLRWVGVGMTVEIR